MQQQILIVYWSIEILLWMIMLHVYDIMNIGWIIFIDYLRIPIFYLIKLLIIFLLQNFNMESWVMTMVYYGWKMHLNLIFHQMKRLKFLLTNIWQLIKPFFKRNFIMRKHTNINKHAKKKTWQQIGRFQYLEPLMRCKKILLFMNEENLGSN
jgi:hypothetical protein